MKNSKSVYNADKENSIFAVKLRRLFEETKKTQQELIDFIQIKTGKAPTRQAVSAWTHGNSPDIKTVPIIAEFFSVSTDFLLTETEIRPIDVELSAVCEYTGLSPKSIKNLKAMKAHQLNADLLLEQDGLEKIVEHLCEIEQLAIERDYYERVIYPISVEDEFYDNLNLNDVKMCKPRCDKFIKQFPNKSERFQDCSKCDQCELDKDFVFKEIINALRSVLERRYGLINAYCPDWFSDVFQDDTELFEYKLAKDLFSLVNNVKSTINSTQFFSSNNRYIRERLAESLNDAKQHLAHEKEDFDSGKYETWAHPEDCIELIENSENKIKALETYLEKYDENFKLKKGT